MGCGKCKYFKPLKEHPDGAVYGICEHKDATWKNDADQPGTWADNHCIIKTESYPDRYAFEPKE